MTRNDPAGSGPGARTRVLVGGTFDLLHAGHVNMLHRAREYGDWLIVGVFDDSSVKPTVLPAEERARQVRLLRFVDEVRIYTSPLDLYTAVAPDVVVQGADWLETGPDRAEIIAAVTSQGGRVVLVPRTAGISTTEIKSMVGKAP